MTGDGLEREALALFEAMLDIAEAQRDAWIASRTSDNPQLASRLFAMREANRRAELQTGAAIAELDEEEPPERIGAYRIVERIGRGGMGSVYRGERDTGDFAHVVAIKIIKPGLLSETLVDRFQRERQTLARLVHPHIAQLYDGGETESGSPFIVMEHVDGLPMLQWIEAHDAGPPQRLRLFGDICGAVAFANRNFIAHRDLTPSNVLVTGDGVVKLIDFGIAKPLDEEGMAGERTSSASIGSLSLTPGYAAPERMVSAQVTTAADIYSLGKLLERILPPSPGDKELRAIIARATAADPAQRYPTADALGADVDAWHRGFPVQALPQTRAYHVRKFVRRHRLGVAAALIALIVLVGALALTIAAYARADAARKAEAARFAELRSLARYMIFDLETELARVAGNTRARVALTDRAQLYLSALAASPTADDALKLEAARGFITLAHAQGVPGQPNLGRHDLAEANLTQALTMLRASSLPQRQVAPDMVQALSGHAMIQANTAKDMDQARKDVAQADRLLAAVPPSDRSTRWHEARRTLRRAQLEMATLDNDQPTLLRLSAALESEIGQWPPAMRASYLARFDQAYAYYYRATHAYFVDNLAQGVDLNMQAEAILKELDRERPDDPVILYTRAWNAYIGYGNASSVPSRASEGKAFVALAVTMLDRLLRMEANDNALKAFAGNILQTQSQSLSDDGHHSEAIAVQQRRIALLDTELRQERKATLLNRMAMAQVTMAQIAKAASDPALQCRSYRAAADVIAELKRANGLLGFVKSRQTEVTENLAGCGKG